MRKWLIAAFVAILAFGGYQIGETYAYPGGLLDGKLLWTGTNNNFVTQATDDDQTTSIVLAKNKAGQSYRDDLLGYYVPYAPPSSFTVNAYQVSGTGSLRIDLYTDSGMSPTQTITVVADGAKHTFSTVTGVQRLYLVNASTTATATVKEFDIFGSYVDKMPPNAPTDLTASAGDSKAILSWTTPTGGGVISGYNVYKGGVKVNSSLIKSNTYTVTGLTNAMTYSFQVTAVDDSGNESEKSTAVSVYLPDLDAPSKPTGLVATASGLKAILSWNANTESDLAGYSVYQDGSLIATGLTTTSYTATGLSPKTTYKYQVAAFDTDGNISEKSDQASVTTPDVMSVNFVPNKDSIIVQIMGGAPPYFVDWGEGSESVNATNYTIPNLTEDTDYTVTVTDDTGKTITQTVNTGHMKAFVPPVFPAPDGIFQMMLDNFGTAGTIAIAIIGGAVALGILCILGIWGWRLLKRWLAAAR